LSPIRGIYATIYLGLNSQVYKAAVSLQIFTALYIDNYQSRSYTIADLWWVRGCVKAGLLTMR